MKTHINKIEQKTSKAGKVYWLVDTPLGNMSIWEKNVVDEVSSFVGGECDLITKRNGDFTNVVGVNNSETLRDVPAMPESKGGKLASSVQSKETREYVEFAKDIFLTLKVQNKEAKNEALMENALELVGKARVFFEGWSE